MAATIGLLDTVALLVDLPEWGLKAGEVGAVVEILSDGRAFEVEFVDNTGTPYGLHALERDQIMALHTQGHALQLPGDAA